MANRNQSPCVDCWRVKDPQNCQNKSCAIWQEWFLRTWAAMQKRCGVVPQEERVEE